jgi:hypothetical protein
MKKQSPVVNEVLNNPYRLCSLPEIAACVKKSPEFVRAARRAGFKMPGGVARPEWFVEWLRATPDFVVKENE